jgi:tripartite-type tricarboxylate transporter receptor subunit TctC
MNRYAGVMLAGLVLSMAPVDAQNSPDHQVKIIVPCPAVQMHA